jgi:hypothetical protein
MVFHIFDLQCNILVLYYIVFCKNVRHDITEILLKVALNNITLKNLILSQEFASFQNV